MKAQDIQIHRMILYSWVMAVIKENKDFFEYVPESLKNDPEFMKEVEQYLE